MDFTDMPRVMTTEDVAERMRVSPAEVKRWMASGKLRYSKNAPNSIHRNDLEEFLYWYGSIRVSRKQGHKER